MQFFRMFFLMLLSAAASPGAVLVPASDPRIQYTGRIDFSDPLAPRFDWPAISVGAVFQGGSVGILLKDGNNDYDAFIDGNLREVIVGVPEERYLIQGLTKGRHTLLLVKRTEASFGIGTFKGLELENGASLLAPPPRPMRRIEIIGDSLACGAEVEDLDTACDAPHFRTTENVFLSYGAVSARALGAEYRITAWSAKGMVRNAGDGEVSQDPMPSYFHRLLGNLKTPPYIPGAWDPQAVVVLLGGNDFYTGGVHPSRDEFEVGYRSFLAMLRADYPKARIVCLCFSDSNPMGTYIQEVVRAENDDGEKMVNYAELGYPRGHLTGCYSHPDVEGQKLIAQDLTRVLGGLMGWREGSRSRAPAASLVP